MLKALKILLFLAIICNCAFAEQSRIQDRHFANRKEVQKFVHEMHKKHGFDKTQLSALFKEFKTEKKILKTMNKQYEAQPWYHYQKNLVTEKRITEGVAFWKQNKVLLNKAEIHFGVPAEIIVAILGIESSYGKNTGNYPVFQVLATLAFDYPRRAKFFREELEQFLLLTHEEKLDPKLIRGSYAGAMGSAQFMPSSYRRYGVDFSGKGRKNLLDDKADIIGSVANYLKQNGWQRNEIIAHPVTMKGQKHSSLLKSKDLKPNLPLTKLNQYNIQFSNLKIAKHKHQKVKVIQFESSKTSKEHWIAFNNFYVITRYNRSNHYAMAVYQLSQRIKMAYSGLNND